MKNNPLSPVSLKDTSRWEQPSYLIFFHYVVSLHLCMWVQCPRKSEEGVTGCGTVDARNWTWVLWRVACTFNHWAVLPILSRDTFHIDPSFKLGCFAHTSLENNSVMLQQTRGLFKAENLPELLGGGGRRGEQRHSVILFMPLAIVLVI